MKKIIVIAIALVTATLTYGEVDAKVKALYKKECSRCHGAEGKGETKMGKKLGAKDYSDPEVQAKLKDEQAFKVVREGLTEDGKNKMKANSEMKDQEIKDLVAYMRTFKKK
jgi:mono/diheme cytochrome c family protein